MFFYAILLEADCEGRVAYDSPKNGKKFHVWELEVSILGKTQMARSTSKNRPVRYFV
jgi:hypothetical protein